MKIALIKHFNGLKAAYNSDLENIKKLKEGVIYEVNIKKPRNIMFHRKFFALINLVFENQETFDNSNDLRYYLTMKAGFYKKVKTPNNGEMFIPKSLKFDKMDNVEFEEVYNGVIKVIEKELLITKQDILENIQEYF
jgi:hypothetical protein